MPESGNFGNKNPNEEEKKLGRLSNFLQAAVLGASLLGKAIEGQEDIPKTTQEENLKENEGYWLNLNSGEVFRRYAEYKGKDFVEHLLEHHIQKDPVQYVLNAPSLDTNPNHLKLLTRTLEETIDGNVYQDNAFQCGFLIQPKIVEYYKVLNNYGSFIARASEKMIENYSKQILMYAENLFTHLSQTVAEGIVHRAAYKVQEQDPIWLLIEGVNIKKYVPNADSILINAAESCIKENAVTFLSKFSDLIKKEEIFSREQIKDLTEKIVEEDPAHAYLQIHANQDYFEEDFGVNSALITQLQFISKDENLKDEEKAEIATFVDALIFDKHLSHQELLTILKDETKTRKLIEEITSRRNYTGTQSIKRYLSKLNQKDTIYSYTDQENQ